MNVEHDEEWLGQSQLTGDTILGIKTHVEYSRLDIKKAKLYHEHMMRWRPINQAPKSGQWIEVLCNELGDIHSITYGPAQFNEIDLGWRPAVALPVIAKDS